MKSQSMASIVLLALLVTAVSADTSRKLLQATPTATTAPFRVFAGTPPTLTVSAANPIVNAIAITLAQPYPQRAYYCNVTGDSRIPQQGPFPITVRVPVGVQATVIFANITGPIPGTACTAVSQPGATVIQQPNSVVQQSTSVQQMVANPSSVVQQAGGSAVVQQQYASSINQQQVQPAAYFNCVGNVSTVVQQPGSTTSVVQQPGSGTSVVQQPGSGTSVVQQPTTTTSVVQQPTQTPASTPRAATSVVQQPATTPAPTTASTTRPAATVVQQNVPVVQQSPPSAPVVQQSSPVVQQSSPVVQQSSPVVQQSSPVVQQGRHLLQAGTIEYISNNGSTGQPQLTVLDTVEGVPNISFKPTQAGQTAVFIGALQVAVTTTNDGFGTPFIPYRVDSRLSPQCGVQVNFVGV